MAQDPYAGIGVPAAAPGGLSAMLRSVTAPRARTGTVDDIENSIDRAAARRNQNDALLRRYAGMTPDHATQIYQTARTRLAQAHADPAERARALTAFDTAPAVRAIRQIAGLVPLSTNAQDIRDVAAQAAGLNRSNRVDATGRQWAADAQNRQREQGAADSSDFVTAAFGGADHALLDVPARIAAAGNRWLPSAITGNNTDYNYDELLQASRAGLDRDASLSLPGNITGNILGSLALTRGAGSVIGGTRAILGVGGPLAVRAGNVLQSLTTMQRGQRLANAGRIAVAGGTMGAAQAAGTGGDPVEGAVTGAIAAPVLGLGFKAAQVVTRPFRDFLRLSSAGRILNRLTSATQDQLEQRAAEYRTSTGAEPTVFELLPLADRNRILRQTVVGRDNVVEQASNAIRARANNLGPEMLRRVRSVLQPRRDAAARDIRENLINARGGTPAIGDVALVERATNSPTDMSELRDTEARAIMAPHENAPVAPSLENLYPSVPNPNGGADIEVDPEVSTVIRSAAGTLRRRPQNAGVTVGDVTNIISTLRGDLGKGGTEGRTAQRAIDHLQDTLDVAQPEAGAAHQQMTDAYAARSRMMEGMKEGSATRLRDENQVGTSRREARRVRNAYDTPEGATGRSFGQGNRVLTDLGGSPEEALRSTVRMSRNSTGRELSQNVGPAEAEQIMAAARSQDTSAQALSAASQTAQSGGGEASNAETLVQSLVGLHPSSFITTKIGAVRRLIDMTYIPEGRARAMVDMLFSQNPDMARRALNAIGNEPNGAQFMRYLSGVAGSLSGNTPPPHENDIPQQEEETPSIEAPAETPAADEYEGVPDTENIETPPATENNDVPEGTPIAAGDSNYAEHLQHIYNTESPELLNLVNRVEHQESGGHQHDAHGRPLTSSAGAVGVMQVTPDTARNAARLAGVPWDNHAYHHDATYNRLLGITELSNQLRRYNGDVRLALIAYNAGPGRADRVAAGHARIPRETQNYIASIM